MRLPSDFGAEEGRQHAIGCVDVVAQCETDRRSIACAKRCKHELVLFVRLEVIAGCVEEYPSGGGRLAVRAHVAKGVTIELALR